MNVDRIRELVANNFLKVMMDKENNTLRLYSPKTKLGKNVYEEIKENKEKIIQYIMEYPKKKDRIDTILYHLKQMEEKKAAIHFNWDTTDPYKKLDFNKIEDLDKAIEIAKQNKDKADLDYFTAKKVMMEEVKPTAEEIARAKVYNSIVEKTCSFAQAFKEFAYFTIGVKYRDRILFSDESPGKIEADFDKEISLYSDCKGYIAFSMNEFI